MKEINNAINSIFLTVVLIITSIINSKYLITNYRNFQNNKSDSQQTNTNNPLKQNNLVQTKSKSQIIKKHSEILLIISIITLIFLIAIIYYYRYLTFKKNK